MRSTANLLALLLVAAACGDDGGGTDAGFDAGVDAGSEAGPADAGADALDCARVRADLVAFLADNRTCTMASDCIAANLQCAMDLEEGCCTTYLRREIDVSRLSELNEMSRQCAGVTTCECCLQAPPDPACNAGRCGPMAP